MDHVQPLEFVTMPLNPYSLGMVADFLSHFPVFEEFNFGATMNAISYQLSSGCHLVASRDDRMRAYLGWVRTSRAVAENWVQSEGQLYPVDGGLDVAITIMAAEDPKLMLPLLREAKRRNMVGNVYWRRYFGDGRASSLRSVKKA